MYFDWRGWVTGIYVTDNDLRVAKGSKTKRGYISAQTSHENARIGQIMPDNEPVRVNGGPEGKALLKLEGLT